MGFKLMLVVPWRMKRVRTSGFTAKHSGVSNPSLFLSCHEFRYVKATFVVGFHFSGAYDSGGGLGFSWLNP